MQQLQQNNDAALFGNQGTICRAPNRELKGIHFAMKFLSANTKKVCWTILGQDGNYISAKDKLRHHGGVAVIRVQTVSVLLFVMAVNRWLILS